MSNITIGIDPGNKGGVAVLRGDELVQLTAMPLLSVKMSGRKRFVINRWELADWLRPYSADLSSENVTAYVELVRARPQQGISSTARFAEGFGVILGVTAAHRITTYQVSPSRWRMEMVGRGTDKHAARYRAMERWPAWADAFRRVKDDGVAEAALLAEYGRRQAARMEGGDA